MKLQDAGLYEPRKEPPDDEGCGAEGCDGETCQECCPHDDVEGGYCCDCELECHEYMRWE